MHCPETCRIPLGRDGAATRLRFERTMHTPQFHAAGARIGAYRARRRLLQRNMPATRMALESAGDVPRANRTTSRLRAHIALDPIDGNFSRARLSANRVTDVGDIQTSRPRLDLDASPNAFHALTAGTSVRV